MNYARMYGCVGFYLSIKVFLSFVCWLQYLLMVEPWYATQASRCFRKILSFRKCVSHFVPSGSYVADSYSTVFDSNCETR